MANLTYQYRIHPQDLAFNPRSLYVFGDNVLRTGYAGQAAACRGRQNAHGIATLWEPGRYYQDKDYLRIIEIIGADLDQLHAELAYGKWDTLVFPADGIGTGLAYMAKTAPKCYDYMCTQLESRFGIVNNISKQYLQRLTGRELGQVIVDEVGYVPRGISETES